MAQDSQRMVRRGGNERDAALEALCAFGLCIGPCETVCRNALDVCLEAKTGNSLLAAVILCVVCGEDSSTTQQCLEQLMT